MKIILTLTARRSYAAFLALGEDACAAAWEMDTVEGAREDSACLLTLLHRPSRLQLALLLGEKTSGCVAAALEGVRAVLGADGTRRVFRAVLTDNGAEFSDEGAIAALLGEGPARRGCSTATRAAATRRAPASATTSRSGSCCPRAPGSGSTGYPRPTWRSPCRT